MKVLVCGAAGFMGKAICARLAAAGHEVVRGVRMSVRLYGTRLRWVGWRSLPASAGMRCRSAIGVMQKRRELLGYPAFTAMVVVYFLMVVKPA